MKTTETPRSTKHGGTRKNPYFSVRKKRLGERPVTITCEPPFQDRIARAFAREREHTRVLPWPPEYELVIAHCFNCVCCGKTRGNELRREPSSEVCLHCVAAAGFSPN